MGINKINVEVTDNDIKEMLRKNIVMPKASKFIDLLIGHICKERIAMEQIYKALLGIYPVFNYKAGDWIYVDYTHLAMWRVDKEATMALPSVKEGKLIPCVIYEVDIYTDMPYKIKYEAIKDGKNIQQDYYVTDSIIHSKVEKLEDVLDEMEAIKIVDVDSLPF
jgi:hypothetical protein